jgi:hypothetical protein
MDFNEINPLAKVKIKHSLKSFVQQNTLIDQIVKHVQTIPNYQNLKNDVELIKYVCKMIEQLVKQGNSKQPIGIKIDKKQLAITIFNQIFGLSPTEISFISSLIEFFVQNEIVKKKTCLSKLSDVVSSKLPTLPK